jgi:hypothetical protein
VETSITTRLPISAAASAMLFFASDCSTLPDPLGCRLNNFLHILYIAAAVLGVALLIVAILAYRTYRQNKADAAVDTRSEQEKKSHD